MKMKLLTLLAILSFGTLSFAQSISNNLGSVSCEFTFTTNGENLEVKKQLLTERAQARSEKSESENQSYGLGLGYTEWHLEFVLTNKIGTRYRQDDENIWHRGKYSIHLMDKNRATLLKTYMTAGRLRQWQGGTITEPIYIYSWDLIEFPLVILDDVVYVDIVLIN